MTAGIGKCALRDVPDSSVLSVAQEESKVDLRLVFWDARSTRAGADFLPCHFVLKSVKSIAARSFWEPAHSWHLNIEIGQHLGVPCFLVGAELQFVYQ